MGISLLKPKKQGARYLAYVVAKAYASIISSPFRERSGGGLGKTKETLLSCSPKTGGNMLVSPHSWPPLMLRGEGF